MVSRRGEQLPSPKDLIDTVRDLVQSTGLTLILEPGRSLVATSAALINTVRALPRAQCRLPLSGCLSDRTNRVSNCC